MNSWEHIHYHRELERELLVQARYRRVSRPRRRRVFLRRLFLIIATFTRGIAEHMERLADGDTYAGGCVERTTPCKQG